MIQSSDKGYHNTARKQFDFNGETYLYYDILSLDKEGYDIKSLPFTIRVLLESVLRQWDGRAITEEHIINLANWTKGNNGEGEVPFKPARVLLQDFTGVPAVVDLASMRQALVDTLKDKGVSDLINPEVSVDLVIDHSVQVDYYGTSAALDENMQLEFKRNKERYEFLNWAKGAFDNFSVIPPDMGIVHQINLEYLASVVIKKKDGDSYIAYPDTLVGTDSHTTMINGLGVLGWGVGGIEAEAGMLGQPSYFPLPEVIGVQLTGELPAGSTATDLALTITQLLRQRGVVGKFVEYFGSGVASLSLAERATIANMAPEYGATCGFFPVDEETLDYLLLTGRSKEQVDFVRTYLKKNHMLYDNSAKEPKYSEVIQLDLSSVIPSLSGPKRPQDLIPLNDMKDAFVKSVSLPQGNHGHGLSEAELQKEKEIVFKDGRRSTIKTGAVVIAAITSCTNTSNPSVMLGAGLLAKNAVERGLKVPPYVKTSLAPGSRATTDYLEAAGLQSYLDQLGFNTVGYGCTTCIGNSGSLLPEVASAIEDEGLLVTSVLSGNRNFEGRIHSLVKANYLAAPPLVVAYALAGTVNIDLTKEPIGKDTEEKDVFLKDIWPSSEELKEVLAQTLNPQLFRKVYQEVYNSNDLWNSINVNESKLYHFSEESTYIQNPPYFTELSHEPENIKSLSNLRVLAKFGDTVTTDHISPAGAIGRNTPAGKYLMEHGISPKDFNTYGSRRGNHEVMMRGTFANIRIRNHLLPGTEGGYTCYWPTEEVMPIYDAAMRYKKQNIGLVILAGKDYGMGSSRDWAAKGPNLLGVKVVIAESFERIHRSNLVMMGILPLQFIEGDTAETLGLAGDETYEVNIDDTVKPRDIIDVVAVSRNGDKKKFKAIVRFDSVVDVDYYRHGGILPMVLREKIQGI